MSGSEPGPREGRTAPGCTSGLFSGDKISLQGGRGRERLAGTATYPARRGAGQARRNNNGGAPLLEHSLT